MQDIFIGVDGGGTKTKVRVEDSQQQLLGQSVGDSACIRISVDAAWNAIYTALDEILRPQHISLHDPQYRFHAGMGLSGCEVKEAYHDFLHRSHPFTTLVLASDAHTACLGAHQGVDGAIIIAGTGVVGYEIEAGQGSQVGGWGFPHDDEGGGAWLGLEATRLAFQWLDRRAEKSPLATDVFAYFDNDLDKMVAWSNSANSTEFARLAPLVINHSQQEEIAAVRIMKKAAHAVDRIGYALGKMHGDVKRPLPCSFLGGIAPFLEPLLCEELRQSLVPRQADANAGAILMVRNILELA